jgi:hypothetical protein
MAKEERRGRPSKYKTEYARQAKKLCELGATDLDLAEFFQVNPSTIYEWKAKYKLFSKALKVGKDVPDIKVERSLYQRAVGYSVVETKIATFNGQITDQVDIIKQYPPDTTACIFWLKNRRPDEYRMFGPGDQESGGDVNETLKELADKLPG